MFEILNYYLLFGFFWLMLHELLGYKMDNGMRFRLWAFWPVTLTAWIVGIIEAFINSDE